MKGDLWGYVDEVNKKKFEISKINDTVVLRVDGALSRERISRIINKQVQKILKDKNVQKLNKNSSYDNKSLTQFTGL